MSPQAKQSPFWWARAAAVLLLVSLLGAAIMPLTLSAEEDVLHFAATGQAVSNANGFLTYWREHDGARLLGRPVTVELLEAGRVVQYFEHGRLEFHPEQTAGPILRGRVGAEYAAALWKTFETAPPRVPSASEYFFEATSHTLSEPFLRFWQANGGLTTFGYPISEPLWEYVGSQMLQVQYFERARLEHHPLASGTPDEVQISALGRDLALLRGYDMGEAVPIAAPEAPPVVAVAEAAAEAAEAAEPAEAPAAEAAAEAAEPAEPAEAAEPAAAPAPAAPAPAPAAPAPLPADTDAGWPWSQESPAAEAAAWQVLFDGPVQNGKSVIVNLTHQWLYAYENGVLAFDAPISTGMDSYATPTGDFFIYARNPLQTMSGTLNGEFYEVSHVTYAMYINDDVAIHGTYWHNDFGTGVRRSHGCINLTIDSAGQLYRWAPLGTPVRVTY